MDVVRSWPHMRTIVRSSYGTVTTRHDLDLRRLKALCR